MPDPANPFAISSGSVIGDTYRVVRQIGEGGMGAVWEAEHARLPGKRVAIKVLLAEVAKDADALARFQREAHIAAGLGHANIVKVEDYNTLPDGKPYIVMEFLRGESLDARLARGPIPLSETTRILRQVSSALRAAHEASVIHRDLKPQNVFLCPHEEDGEIRVTAKVLDFGISKILASNTVKTQTSTVLGTPQYMAPEQATGKHDQVDARTDVFCLGIMAYEMLAGKPPFTGQTVPEVVFKIVYEPAPDLSQICIDVPRSTTNAVHKALAKSQDERFANVSEFIEAFSGRPLASTGVGHASMSTGVGSAVHKTGEDAFAATMDSGARDAALLAGKREAANSALANSATLHASQGSQTSAELVTSTPSAAQARSRWPLALAILVLVAGAGVAVFAMSQSGRQTKTADNAGQGVTQEPAAKESGNQVASPATKTTAALPDAAPVEAAGGAPPSEDGQVESTATNETSAVSENVGKKEKSTANNIAGKREKSSVSDIAGKKTESTASKTARKGAADSDTSPQENHTGSGAGPTPPAEGPDFLDTQNAQSYGPNAPLVQMFGRSAGTRIKGPSRYYLLESIRHYRSGDWSSAARSADIAAKNNGGEYAQTLKALAYCGQRNTSRAHAAYAQIRSKGLRKSVHAACLKNGLLVAAP